MRSGIILYVSCCLYKCGTVNRDVPAWFVLKDDWDAPQRNNILENRTCPILTLRPFSGHNDHQGRFRNFLLSQRLKALIRLGVTINNLRLMFASLCNDRCHCTDCKNNRETSGKCYIQNGDNSWWKLMQGGKRFKAFSSSSTSFSYCRSVSYFPKASGLSKRNVSIRRFMSLCRKTTCLWHSTVQSPWWN